MLSQKKTFQLIKMVRGMSLQGIRTRLCDVEARVEDRKLYTRQMKLFSRLHHKKMAPLKSCLPVGGCRVNPNAGVFLWL